MAADKKSQQLARSLFRASVVDGRLSAEHVAGVLEWVEKNRPRRAAAVLRHYRRLVAAEVARGLALVEHSGPVAQATLDAIGAAMARRYKRPLSTAARPNPSLIAGLRITVGCDVFEASIASQLAGLGGRP